MRHRLTFILLFLSLHVFANDTTKVLFIGNSFVASNNMPAIFDNLAKGAGHHVKVVSHAPGGVYVGDTRPGPLSHAYDPFVYNLIRSDKWEYIVIQDNQGFYSYGVGVYPPYSMVVEGHRALRDSAVANNPCAKVVLFSGWCFKNGWPPDFSNGSDMNQRVYENYNFINKTLDEIVSPIGIAWNRMIKKQPATDLWATDEAHPSYAGSYVTAATIYSTIFRSSAEKVNYKGSLDSATARLMRKTAYETVMDSLVPTYLSKHTVQLNVNGSQLSSSAGFKKYDWYKDNVLLGSTTTPSYSPATGGQCYQVVVTGNDNCKQRSATVCNHTASVANTEAAEDVVRIYPNPATDAFYIKLQQPSPIAVNVYDLTGRRVYTKRHETPTGSVCKIELPALSAGAYLVQVQTNDGLYTRRVTIESR